MSGKLLDKLNSSPSTTVKITKEEENPIWEGLEHPKPDRLVELEKSMAMERENDTLRQNFTHLSQEFRELEKLVKTNKKFEYLEFVQLKSKLNRELNTKQLQVDTLEQQLKGQQEQNVELVKELIKQQEQNEELAEKLKTQQNQTGFLNTRINTLVEEKTKLMKEKAKSDNLKRISRRRRKQNNQNKPTKGSVQMRY